MTLAEIARELQVDEAKVRAWIKQGLPRGGTARKPDFDAEVVSKWLVDRGLYKRPLGIATSLRDVARHFGVSSRAVGYWKDGGMPWQPGRYDLDAIEAWRAAQRGNDNEQEEDTRGYWETKRSRAAAMLAELALGQKRGELIEVDLAARLVGQHVAAVKAQLEQLPDYVLSLVKLPPAGKRSLRDGCRKKVRDLCEAFQRSLADLAAAVKSHGAEEAEGEDA